MNVFDVGGLISFMALVASIIIGTVIYKLLNKMFDIVYFGFGAIIGMWCSCCLAGAIIINVVLGIIGVALSKIWVLIKIGLIIIVAGLVVKFIYDKIVENNQ